MPTGHRAQGNHALPVVALDIQQPQVFGLGALRVRHFQDDLVLVGGLLNQVTVVLRVGIVQQAQDPRFRDAIDLRLFPQNVHLQIGSVVVKVRVDEQESRIGPQLRHQLLGGAVDLGGIDAGDGVGKLPLRVGRGAGADLQHRVRLQEGRYAGNAHRDSHHAAPTTAKAMGLRLAGSLRKASTNAWFAGHEAADVAHGEGRAQHRRIGVQHVFHLGHELLAFGRARFLPGPRPRRAASSCRLRAETTWVCC